MKVRSAVAVWLLLLLAGMARAQEEPRLGLGAKYRGDVGIEQDQEVVFVEDFEQGSLEELFGRWDDVANEDGQVVAFAEDVVPGSPGGRSLRVTATRGHDSGGHLFKVFQPGHDRLYVRFYTKFASDYGLCHHFVRIRGMIDPVPYPLGQISKEPSTRWCGTDIEPVRDSQLGRPGAPVAPPGVWALSSYWPEMKSWQGPGGTSFYPDLFAPKEPVPVPRDRWVCVEVMVKMNSSPERSDGEQAFWIDGRLVSHLAPGSVRGYWQRDKYILDDQKGTPFEGFRWRRDMRLNWNRLWLLHYVSDSVFEETDTYASLHPELTINTGSAAVWFDHIVVARSYVGPLAPAPSLQVEERDPAVAEDTQLPEGGKQPMGETVKVAAVQAKRRLVSYKVATPEEALRKVHENLDVLIPLAEQAAGMGCDIVAFPEDTLGTIEWEAGHPDEVAALLSGAEAAMLSRFGEVAAKHRMYIICGSDTLEEGRVYCSAILIGRDGKEIGRYHKVHPPLLEPSTPGDGFPVFEAPGVGTVGMCICYDITMPETTRALALAGADIVFHITMGGASMAGPEASLACFKARAAENFIYLVSAFRGGGSLIISPKGEVLADGGHEPDAIVSAEVNLAAGRDAGDALGGVTADFRARLFRERNPRAYGLLMNENPPILDKLKDVHVPTREEAQALFADAITTGAEAFYEAERLLSEGKTEEARQRFEALSRRFGTTWIGRAARERLQRMAGGQN